MRPQSGPGVCNEGAEVCRVACPISPSPNCFAGEWSLHGFERVVYAADELVQVLAMHVETIGDFGDEKTAVRIRRNLLQPKLGG